jgi:hypothetical protein
MMKSFINCFTGSIVHILNDSSIHESDLILLGGGYLLRSGLDEYGLPEITFPVQRCGEAALEKLGVSYKNISLAPAIDFDEVKMLCKRNNGVIAWTNSAHLNYSSLYSMNLGYLHSIVISDVENGMVKVFDPLVVDIPPYATHGEMSLAQATLALSDVVKTDTYNLMGKLLVIHPCKRIEFSCELKQQNMRQLSELFFQNDECLLSIDKYIALNQSLYKSADSAMKKTISRRLFDHVQVLYIIPILNMLLSKSDSLKIKNHLTEEIRQWQTVAMMALKNSKILSDRVFDKIIITLENCSQFRKQYWESIRNESVSNWC